MILNENIILLFFYSKLLKYLELNVSNSKVFLEEASSSETAALLLKMSWSVFGTCHAELKQCVTARLLSFNILSHISLHGLICE